MKYLKFFENNGIIEEVDSSVSGFELTDSEFEKIKKIILRNYPGLKLLFRKVYGNNIINISYDGDFINFQILLSSYKDDYYLLNVRLHNEEKSYKIDGIDTIKDIFSHVNDTIEEYKKLSNYYDEVMREYNDKMDLIYNNLIEKITI